jgi:hypothetical protein
MPGFVLGEEVLGLEYNFEPYAGAGQIPEPSSMQINAFRSALGTLYSESRANAPDTEDPDVEKITEFLSRDTTEIDEKLLHAVAAVCSDSPSFDDLSALPYRGLQAFMGWLTKVLLLPEAPRPATSS